MAILNERATGSIGKSAILYNNSICIGFPNLLNAEKAIEKLNGSRFCGSLAKVELIVDSPLTEILKCVKPNVTLPTKSNSEVKQLTFIKMNNPNEADTGKIIKFCVACTPLAGSQCILSSESFLWIVFSYKSEAQKFLPKVQIIFPDAVISEPPVDVALQSQENSYTVKSCEEIVKNGDPKHVISLDGCDDNDWKMFFRYDANFIAPMIYYEPTKWSLLYNLFEQLYDLGAKKVIFDGNVYCVHFDSASAYQDAFAELRSRYFEPLELFYSELQKQEFTKKMNQYNGIPWCLNEKLNLCCLVIKIGSQFHNHFIEISKNRLGNRECIFIKSIPGEIWIGFPDEFICKNSKTIVDGFIASLKQVYSINISMAKPSNVLLESINFRDLAGDAYDLAFLSSQLENSKSLTRPHIIERISLQRMQEQECNEAVFQFCVGGKLWDRWSSRLSLEQIVKIVVKLSKVIPLAATASIERINLIYSSWHEAHAARHFISELTSAEVPYLSEFHGTSSIQQQQSGCPNTSDYYIINDTRKVLEKIVQNKSLIDGLDSTSPTVQSTSDVDVLDVEMISKLKFVFIITSNSGFKFTRGMISIIKMNLVSMDCPACIEFEDQIWVGVDDLEKGNKVKSRIEKIKFMLLSENDDDFSVGIVMELIQKSPTNVAIMLANTCKSVNQTKRISRNTYLDSNVFPLGHFNYNYRKAVGMSISRYCQLDGSV